jgi:hypothetical protein
MKGNEIGGTYSMMGDMRNTYKMSIGKPDGKRPFLIRRRGWEDNTRMNLKEIGLEGVNWTHLAQGKDQWWAVVNTVTNLRTP